MVILDLPMISTKKRWDEIFGKEDTSKELDKEEQDYLDSLKEKL